MNKTKIFLVDDDKLYCELLNLELAANPDYQIQSYSSGEECIENLSHQPDVIILDYLLDAGNTNAINGLETLDKIKKFDPRIIVIMLSAQDRIEVAVNCLHHKAADYVVKNETSFIRLKKIISSALEHKTIQEQLAWYMQKM